MAEFLPIKSTEFFVTLRHRTLKLGERLDERARERAWFELPSTADHRQMELTLPNDPEREFVVSIDTAHVRGSRAEAGRNFQIVVARCGRGKVTVLSDGAEIMKRLIKALPQPTAQLRRPL